MNLSKGTRERLAPNPKLRLREQFHEVARFKHLSLRSEEAYWAWAVRFLKFQRRDFTAEARRDGEETPHPDPLPIRPTNAKRGQFCVEEFLARSNGNGEDISKLK